MFLGSLLCLPPYLAFDLFWRSRRRAERRGLPSQRLTLAAGLCFAAFLFNLGAFLLSLNRHLRGTADFTRIEFLAVAVAWVSFWIWLFLALAVGRRLGRTRRRL